MGTRVVASGSSGRRARISSSSSSRPPWVRASATTCAPDLAKARAAARPTPREAPVTSAILGGPSCFDALNRHSLHHLLGLLWAWSREDARLWGRRGRISGGATSVDFLFHRL